MVEKLGHDGLEKKVHAEFEKLDVSGALRSDMVGVVVEERNRGRPGR